MKGEATVDKHVWGENARYLDADNEKIKRKEKKLNFMIIQNNSNWFKSRLWEC